jgi:hypothetical protein
MKEAEIESIECPLKTNKSLLDIKLSFTKNHIRVYDETVLQVQVVPIVSLYVESIVINFNESSMNKEIQIQSELIEGIKCIYEVVLNIEPTIPSIIKVNNLLIYTKFPE